MARFWLGLLLAFALVMGACDGRQEPVDPLAKAAGQQYMKLYYRDHNLEQARELTTGDATAAIDDQLAILTGLSVTDRAKIQRPAVLVSDKRQRTISDSEVELVFEAKPSMPGATAIEVQLSLIKGERGWRVKKTETLMQ